MHGSFPFCSPASSHFPLRRNAKPAVWQRYKQNPSQNADPRLSLFMHFQLGGTSSDAFGFQEIQS
jgi:hypothetical protein